jgi:hypothetical protein
MEKNTRVRRYEGQNSRTLMICELGGDTITPFGPGRVASSNQLADQHGARSARL